MISCRAGIVWAAGLFLSMIAAAPVCGGLSASATISATPDGPNFDYTVSLHNTSSDTAIGTFWFAWTPPGQPVEYDFLPSSPSAASAPSGWVAPISSGSPGTSIEYYNLSGSAIAPGSTGAFQFTTSDTPLQLQGTSLGFPILTSFIYQGLPLSGPTNEVTPAFVPEPASWSLGALACCLLAGRRRRAPVPGTAAEGTHG